jgi:hypothetical protein
VGGWGGGGGGGGGVGVGVRLVLGPGVLRRMARIAFGREGVDILVLVLWFWRV